VFLSAGVDRDHRATGVLTANRRTRLPPIASTTHPMADQAEQGHTTVSHTDISLDGWNIVRADDIDWGSWLGSAATYLVIFKI
jgi:hypothetical protein